MYCRKCGSELPTDGKFCPKCGCEVESITNTKVNSTSKTKKTKPMLIVAVSVLVVALVAVFVGLHIYNENRYADLIADAEQYLEDDDIENAMSCWEKAIDIKPKDSEEIKSELNYYRAVKDANRAIDISDWSQVIEYLEYAIELKPDIVDNYIPLATAYVEQWDLYNASRILSEGYERTQNDSLFDVFIWGPMSVIETAVYTTDGLPFERCEYRFYKDEIYSYIYVEGTPLAGANYICEDEKVKYVSLLDYDDYGITGLMPQQLPPLQPLAYVLMTFDLEYDDTGELSGVSYEKQKLIDISQEDNKITLKALLTYKNLIEANEQMVMIYDENGKLDEIQYQDTTYLYGTQSDGVRTVLLKGTDYRMIFDSKGLWISTSGSLDDDSAIMFTVLTNDEGSISEVREMYATYTFSYENGLLTSIDAVTDDFDYLYCTSMKYIYKEYNDKMWLSEIRYLTNDNVQEILFIAYNEDGRVSSTENSQVVTSFVYEEGKVVEYTVSFKDGDTEDVTYKLNYDYAERFDGRKRVD